MAAKVGFLVVAFFFKTNCSCTFTLQKRLISEYFAHCIEEDLETSDNHDDENMWGSFLLLRWFHLMEKMGRIGA